MKEFFFISGLPRSGSTLLSAILRQNPEFYADISSPVLSMVASTINVITGSESNHLIDEVRRKQILKDLINACAPVEVTKAEADVCAGVPEV